MGRYVTTAAVSSLLCVVLLVSQGCSSAPKRETAFVDDFPTFPQGVPTEAARLQMKQGCQALRKKRAPAVRNEFESQYDYSVFYSSKTKSCSVTKYTIWKNGGEYAAVVDVSGFTPGLCLNTTRQRSQRWRSNVS